LVEVADAVFPYPVYPFCGFVTEIAAIEVAAEKEEELYLLALSLLQLGDLGGFFLSLLVRVREIARRLGFDKYRQG
jgi:hypothetical protein